MITLFVAVCVLSSAHCAPEQPVPGPFKDQAGCEQFVQDVLDGSQHGPLGFTFRCAGQT